MGSFLDMAAEGEKAGVLDSGTVIPAGHYNMSVGTIKARTSKAGNSGLMIVLKSDTGVSTLMSIYISESAYGNALTLKMLEGLGISREFMGRVDTQQGLEPFVAELHRVTQGRWYPMTVTTEPGTGQYANKLSNKFALRTGATAPEPAASFQGGPAIQPAYAPQVQPVAVPVTVTPVTIQPIPAPQAPAYVAAAIPQPASIPQPVQAEPTTGLPPRPGI